MAGKGIRIPLVADVADWLRGMRRVEDSLDDTARDLDRLADRADDAADDVARDFDSAFRKVKADADRNLDSVERDLGDVEDEANQSAKEFGASFRGDPAEALEEVQAYLSEIAAVKLPGFAGAAAAAAGGAGVGAILFAYEQWKERQEEILERAGEFLGVYREAGGAVNDVTDALLAQNVIEEATAEQSRILADLAAARGQNLNDYVLSALQGELSTSQELNDVTQRRAQIADELLALSAARVPIDDARVTSLQAEDKYLADIGNKLRDMGSFLGDNTKSRQLARDAAQAEAAATAQALKAADGLANKDFGRRALQQSADQAARLASNLAQARFETQRIPRSVTVNVQNKLNAGGVIP